MDIAILPNDSNSNDSLQIQPTDNDTPSNVKSIMQMYKQNPIGMFMGVQLSNCTININMPK